jgi:hypothetical protein
MHQPPVWPSWSHSTCDHPSIWPALPFHKAKTNSILRTSQLRTPWSSLQQNTQLCSHPVP